VEKEKGSIQVFSLFKCAALLLQVMPYLQRYMALDVEGSAFFGYYVYVQFTYVCLFAGLAYDKFFIPDKLEQIHDDTFVEFLKSLDSVAELKAICNRKLLPVSV
jgi:hypothetical protein